MALKIQECEIGMAVVYSQIEGSSYNRLKGMYGRITGIDHSTRDPTVIILFYKDKDLTKIHEVECFFPHRLDIDERVTPLKGTKVTRKCQKLWNRSKYVLKNPALIY